MGLQQNCTKSPWVNNSYLSVQEIRITEGAAVGLVLRGVAMMGAAISLNTWLRWLAKRKNIEIIIASSAQSTHLTSLEYLADIYMARFQECPDALVISFDMFQAWIPEPHFESRRLCPCQCAFSILLSSFNWLSLASLVYWQILFHLLLASRVCLGLRWRGCSRAPSHLSSHSIILSRLVLEMASNKERK